ncbi:AsmA family protein [Pseudoduganella aquatica]|uniref:AsmA family protein n=1 Tax=Pseudoduganella aquatica TaxID=2660641 RepID=A0A7X4HH15_9BURK|nr:AsmA family protein [Pseudoduganella aquatica]MYN11121.1 AsmA family protein [Pseudoduganella aquatica]
MPMPRKTKIALAIGATVLAVPAVALVVLLNYDWNRARPWLSEKTSEAIGRPFAIKGNLALTWEKQIVPERERSWRDHLPWPHLVARDVHLGNPAGMEPAEMASVGEFSFSLNPFALLGKEISIPVLRFETPSVLLQRGEDGRNNWTFDKKDKPSPWRLDLQRVVFTKGTVHYKDALAKADATAEIDTINADPLYGVSWKLKGQWRGAPVSGGGKAGAVLSLQQQTAPYPIAADVNLGGTRIAVEGTLTKPAALAALDMKLTLSAPSMARLYALTGIVLPETPPFTTSGHLSATLGKDSGHYTYDKFTGKVGSSDISGHMEYQQKQPRGYLSGNVHSRLLQFADLGPLVGADSNASKEARGLPAVQPSGKVLPVEKFRTERWTSIDADVKFKADRIVREHQLPIAKLETDIHLKDGVLALTPLNFDWAGGTLASNVKLDGSGRTDKNAIRAELKATARHLKLKELFPTLDGLKASVGEINGDASLSATGDSVATLLAGSNGELKALINQGSISKLLLEQMGLNLGNVVLTKLSGDKQVKLNCMAADFAVTKGLAQTREFIIDTDDAVINVNGSVNLASEQLNLTLKPDSKGLRIITLRSPLYVTGTFKQPDVSVDKGVLALKAGGALALAVAAAPVAALLPLINTGPGKDSECGKLLAQARVKPVAPPPGKTLKGKPVRKQ